MFDIVPEHGLRKIGLVDDESNLSESRVTSYSEPTSTPRNPDAFPELMTSTVCCIHGVLKTSLEFTHVIPSHLVTTMEKSSSHVHG